MESTNDKTLSLSDFFAFGIFHLAFYHGHPIYIEKEGRFLLNDNTGEPVMAHDECMGRDCNFCRLMKGQPPIVQPGKNFPPYNVQSITTVFGRRRFLKLGKGHLGNLDGWESAVASACGACGGQMATEGFACPTCENLLIDMETDPRPTMLIQEAVSHPINCMTCQKPVFVKESAFCPACEAQKRTWIENHLTDVVVTGCRQGEGTASTLVMKGHSSIEKFEASRPDITPHLGGKSLRQYIEEAGATQYDFASLFKILPIQDQMKQLDLNLPGLGQTSGPSYTQYPAGGPGPSAPATHGRTNFSK
jgi:hypothetical protein